MVTAEMKGGGAHPGLKVSGLQGIRGDLQIHLGGGNGYVTRTLEETQVWIMTINQLSGNLKNVLYKAEGSQFSFKGKGKCNKDPDTRDAMTKLSVLNLSSHGRVCPAPRLCPHPSTHIF